MLVKPLLRGHFHQAMFFISIGACTTLLFQSSTPLQWLAVSIDGFQHRAEVIADPGGTRVRPPAGHPGLQAIGTEAARADAGADKPKL